MLTAMQRPRPLVIAKREFQSRLLVGTGKFSSPEAMRDALAASVIRLGFIPPPTIRYLQCGMAGLMALFSSCSRLGDGVVVFRITRGKDQRDVAGSGRL